MTEVLSKSKAACKGQETALFFIDNGPLTSKRVRIGIGKAKSICNGCEIKVECFMHAVNNQENYGIWGGTTAKERMRLNASMDSISYSEAVEILKWIKNS